MGVRHLKEERKPIYDPVIEEIKKAKKIHEHFLPRNAQFCEELEIATYYNPAEQIGGDYYNFFKISDEQMVIYLSDVSGHGIDGAMLNIYLKTLIDGLIQPFTKNKNKPLPNKMIKKIIKDFNEAMFAGDYMISLFFGILNLKTFKLIYASTGFQTPMIAFSKDGHVEKREIGGLPISTAIPIDLYEIYNKMIEIKEGTSILLLTDGIIEEERDGEIFGTKKIEEIAESALQKNPEVIKGEIIEAFKQFTVDHKNSDDVTFIILKRRLLDP